MKKKSPVICFIHIEKAAGTTLHHIFRNNFLSYLTLNSWYYWPNEKDSVFTRKEAQVLFKIFPYTKGFGGHTVRSYLGYESVLNRPIHYITFLREPVSRYISHYAFQIFQKGIPWTPESFLNEKRFNNFITRRIAGNEDVDLAKEILLNKFSFVGFTEDFDRSVLLLKKQLHLVDFNINYEKMNVGAKTAKENLDIESPQHYERIIENNRLDLELYKFAEKEIYNKYLTNYNGSLRTDLKEYRANTDGFKFNRTKRYLSSFYRYFVYRNIEFLIKQVFH